MIYRALFNTFLIQVSNRRFVSTAQIQKCDHISILCASQCPCRASVARAQRAQPVLHLIILFMIQSVQLFVHFHVCFVSAADSQAGYKWGESYHATQAKLVEREVVSLAILSRPPPRLLRLVCCSMGWVCVSIQGCLMCIACI